MDTLFFIFLAFLVFICSFVALLRFLRARKIEPPIYAYLAFVVLLLTWDNIYATIAVKYYCYKEGGEHIYKVVEKVEGYYDEGFGGCGGLCKERLMTHKYKFIESNVKPSFYSRDFYRAAKLIDRPGLYRFSLAEKGSPGCKLYYEFHKKYPAAGNRDLQSYGDSYCISSKKIKKLKSRYSYHAGDSEKVIPFILKRFSSVTDMQTGEKIATATTFANYAGWIHYLYHGPTMGTHCPADTSIHYKILYNSLSPSK